MFRVFRVFRVVGFWGFRVLGFRVLGFHGFMVLGFWGFLGLKRFFRGVTLVTLRTFFLLWGCGGQRNPLRPPDRRPRMALGGGRAVGRGRGRGGKGGEGGNYLSPAAACRPPTRSASIKVTQKPVLHHSCSILRLVLHCLIGSGIGINYKFVGFLLSINVIASFFSLSLSAPMFVQSAGSASFPPTFSTRFGRHPPRTSSTLRTGQVRLPACPIRPHLQRYA